MSHVTNIIVVCDVEEKKYIDSLNQWIKENYMKKFKIKFQDYFKQVDAFAGGNKAIERDIYLGAFNYFPLEDFSRWIRIEKLTMELGDTFQVFVCDEHDERFEEILTDKEYRIRYGSHPNGSSISKPQEMNKYG